jgi:hypothetical protein
MSLEYLIQVIHSLMAPKCLMEGQFSFSMDLMKLKFNNFNRWVTKLSLVQVILEDIKEFYMIKIKEYTTVLHSLEKMVNLQDIDIGINEIA